MQVLTIEATDLGNRSYAVTDGVDVVVIDPPRPPGRVLELLSGRGLTPTLVLETHLHNDHISGGRELVEASGARYGAPAADRVVGAEGLHGGDVLRCGALHIEVVATPGHTRHHQSFVVTEGGHRAVFTGGSLLVGTVGRTDLLGADLAAELAGAQWTSVRHLLASLPEDAAVHPTHGFGSFCSATPAAGTETTIGAERGRNPAALLERRPFVETMLESYGDYPSYYAHMAERNRAGGAVRAYEAAVPELAAADLDDRRDVWVIDLRPRADFAGGHLARSVAIGADGPLATYAGWVLPWGAPLALVAGDRPTLAAARAALAHIGLDRPVATAVLGPGEGGCRMRRATFAELAAERRGGDITVVDVRREEEWRASHLADAVNIPLHRLDPEALPDGPLWLHCAAGYRAVLAASLLARTGRPAVAVDDAWPAAAAAGLPISSAVPHPAVPQAAVPHPAVPQAAVR